MVAQDLTTQGVGWEARMDLMQRERRDGGCMVVGGFLDGSDIICFPF